MLQHQNSYPRQECEQRLNLIAKETIKKQIKIVSNGAQMVWMEITRIHFDANVLKQYSFLRHDKLTRETNLWHGRANNNHA